ncbi:MAG: autotransporter outer membrane beta-barrel domain-containing protein, partial [Rhizobiales bacterium]|nr:autotransporter outer membrane beta-barrel domain-containing protein [Hyphomicrobiales bacterium]
SPDSDVAVASGGTLDLAGYDQTLLSLANSGIVSLAGSRAGTTLTVAGDYAGTGGIVVLAAALGPDGSPADRLVVEGDVSGTTRLSIVNLGGNGALTTGSGIEVVDIAGLSPSDAFTLGRTIAGAYDYRLFQGGVGAEAGDGDWYLRSDLSMAAQTYRAYPATLLAYSATSVGTLMQRTGGWNLGAATTTIPGGAFIRGAGLAAHASPDAGSPYSQDIAFAQTGIAAELPVAVPGLLTAGVTATFGRSRATVDGATHGEAGSGDISSGAYGFGGTLTWWGNDGAYADAVGQLTYFDTDISTGDAGKLAGGTSAYGTALSLEVGKAFEAAPTWRIVPQAQLVYASVGLDDFADADGTAISAGGNGSLIGRTGVRVENSGFLDALAYDAMRYNDYVVGNLYYSFLGDSSITVGNTSLTEAGSDLVAELGIGGALGIGGRANLYGEASYASAFGGGDAWSGSFGLRVQW